MDSSSAIENSEPQVVFRPSKKRKQFRQRAEETEPKADDATSQAAAPPKPAQEADTKLADGDNVEASETEGLSVAEALRLRNARRSRLKGVEFRAEGAPKAAADEDQSLLPKDDAQDSMEFGMSKRFAPQAGLVGELVNKHM